MHTTVFLEEAIEALQVRPKGKYIDATYGKGGHARLISSLGGEVLGIELDPSQLTRISEERIKVVHGNYADIAGIAKDNNFVPTDGVIFDFGLSMHQIAEGERGFSYRNEDEMLDMRIGESEVSAKDIVNSWDEEELSNMFMRYGEELYSSKIAHQIVTERKKKPIHTVGDLLTVIDTATNSDNNTQTYARIFQALRIEVNSEFQNIKNGLEGAVKILKPEGRIVTITFHSLEDRVVKLFARQNSPKLIEKKIDVEIHRRLRSFERSATLRVIEVQKI